MKIRGRTILFCGATCVMSLAVPACFNFGDLGGGGGGPGPTTDGSTSSDGATTQTDGSISGSDGSTSPTVVEIAAGGNHACAVLSNGDLWCWGGDELGGLGIDPTTIKTTCTSAGVTLACNPTPTKVSGISDVVHVSAGAGQTCAIKKDATLWCWGDNDHAQLGHVSGTSGDLTCGSGVACNPTPQQVADLPKMASVSAGATFTCGVSTGGAAYCWGSDTYGQLGDTGTNDLYQSPPVQVGGAGFANVSQIATSSIGLTACALRTTKDVWCWGENTSGEAGHPPNTNGDQIEDAEMRYFTHTPQPVGEAADGSRTAVVNYATAISFAGAVGCALDGDGAPHCWGNSKYGMLGDVGNGMSAFPSPVTISGLTASFTSITGRWTDMCGVDGAGQVWCWGLNNFGQIGNGNDVGNSGSLTCTFPCHTDPFQVTGLTAALLSSNGATLAVRPDGKSIVGWGANYNGALGHVPGQSGDQECAFGDASVACASSPVDVYDFP